MLLWRTESSEDQCVGIIERLADGEHIGESLYVSTLHVTAAIDVRDISIDAPSIAKLS